MERNFKLFEDNNCGDIFSILNEYLENLKIDNIELRKKINNQKELLSNINIEIPKYTIEFLNKCNIETNIMIRKNKIISLKISQINNVMNGFILDNPKYSIKFFKRVIKYFSDLEKYEYCGLINKVIKLLK